MFASQTYTQISLSGFKVQKKSSGLTKVVTSGFCQYVPTTKQYREIKRDMMMMMVEMEPVRTGRFHLVPAGSHWLPKIQWNLPGLHFQKHKRQTMCLHK